MNNQLLLLEDIENLGRKGDIVKAKPGFVRNFLLPKKKAVIADKRTLRLREKLQAERAALAKLDRETSLKLAAELKGKVFDIEVKADQTGHLYGSVTLADVSKVLEENGFSIEKRSVAISKPIKTLGNYPIQLNLKESVQASIILQVKGEGGITAEVIKPKVEEKVPVIEEVPEEEEGV
ncbi:MAG: 50S ribosomal protein L9 [Simkaniaceae bacterium]|nr:50S ribosomal protein L9 [Simkaniaceae bacterium]